MVLRRSFADTDDDLEPSCVSDRVGDSGRAGYKACPSFSTSQHHSYGGGRDGEQAAERANLVSSRGTRSLVGKILFSC